MKAIRRYNEKPKWVTLDGREILISDMEDSHIVNAIHMLQIKKEDWVLEKAILYGMTVEPTDVISWNYSELIAEADKRKLDY